MSPLLTWVLGFIVVYLLIGWATASYLWRCHTNDVEEKDLALTCGSIWPIVWMVLAVHFAVKATDRLFNGLSKRIPL